MLFSHPGNIQTLAAIQEPRQTDRQTERHTYPDTQQSKMDQEPQQKTQIYETARGETSTWPKLSTF